MIRQTRNFKLLRYSIGYNIECASIFSDVGEIRSVLKYVLQFPGICSSKRQLTLSTISFLVASIALSVRYSLSVIFVPGLGYIDDITSLIGSPLNEIKTYQVFLSNMILFHHKIVFSLANDLPLTSKSIHRIQ